MTHLSCFQTLFAHTFTQSKVSRTTLHLKYSTYHSKKKISKSSPRNSRDSLLPFARCFVHLKRFCAGEVASLERRCVVIEINHISTNPHCSSFVSVLAESFNWKSVVFADIVPVFRGRCPTTKFLRFFSTFQHSAFRASQIWCQSKKRSWRIQLEPWRWSCEVFSLLVPIHWQPPLSPEPMSMTYFCITCLIMALRREFDSTVNVKRFGCSSLEQFLRESPDAFYIHTTADTTPRCSCRHIK